MSETRSGGAGALNLIKLCVGAESVESLAVWQARQSERLAAEIGDPRPRHRTRMTPNRRDEVLDGGSLYWVIKGEILARQRIEALDRARDEAGVWRCDIVMNAEIIETLAQGRRPFQGWRYLPGADAPADLTRARAVAGVELPRPLRLQLAEVGVL